MKIKMAKCNCCERVKIPNFHLSINCVCVCVSVWKEREMWHDMMKACAASVSNRIMGAMYCNAIKLQWCLCCCWCCCCFILFSFFRIYRVPSVIIMFFVIAGPQCLCTHCLLCCANAQCINDLLKIFARNMRVPCTPHNWKNAFNFGWQYSLFGFNAVAHILSCFRWH